MAETTKVAVLVGSLRKESLNRKLAKVLIGLAPDHFDFSILEIGDLAFYNQDLENVDVPETWERFRNEIKSADAVLFVTPEYNRSLPAVLKNAVDVGSRPPGQSVWNGKPCAVISGSPGAIGGFGANHHLRQSLMCLNMPTMPAPEGYVGGLGGIFDDEDALNNDRSRVFLGKFVDAFAAWVNQFPGSQEKA